MSPAARGPKGGFLALDGSPQSLPPTRLPAHRPASARSSGWLLLAVLATLVVIGGALYLTARKTVTLEIDGQTATVFTFQPTVGRLLDELGLALSNADLLSPAPDRTLSDGALIRVRRARPVSIQVDGQTLTLRTHQQTVPDLLAEAGIQLNDGDRVQADGRLFPSELPATGQSGPPALLEVTRAVRLILAVDGGTRTFLTTGPTVGDALAALDLSLYEGDAIAPPPETPVRDGLRVSVDRARPITLQVGDVTIQTRTTATHVGEALARAGLALVGEDYSQPPLEAPLPADGLIRVVRVAEDRLVESVAIPFATRYQADPALAPGERVTVQAGAPGLLRRVTLTRGEDGRTVSRRVEMALIEAPVDALVAYGPAAR